MSSGAKKERKKTNENINFEKKIDNLKVSI